MGRFSTENPSINWKKTDKNPENGYNSSLASIIAACFDAMRLEQGRQGVKMGIPGEKQVER
jgi:hypothetical protein